MLWRKSCSVMDAPIVGAHPCAGNSFSWLVAVCAAVESQVIGWGWGGSLVMRWGTVVRNETVDRIAFGLRVARREFCPRHLGSANPVPKTGQDSRKARISGPIHSTRRFRGFYSIGLVRIPERY